MLESLHFVPLKDRDASENMSRFVEACRHELTVFGSGLDFDSNIWDITESLQLRARGNQRFRISFRRLGVESGKP
jgi:hypothetical protein